MRFIAALVHIMWLCGLISEEQAILNFSAFLILKTQQLCSFEAKI